MLHRVGAVMDWDGGRTQLRVLLHGEPPEVCMLLDH